MKIRLQRIRPFDAPCAQTLFIARSGAFWAKGPPTAVGSMPLTTVANTSFTHPLHILYRARLIAAWPGTRRVELYFGSAESLDTHDSGCLRMVGASFYHIFTIVLLPQDANFALRSNPRFTQGCQRHSACTHHIPMKQYANDY